MQPFARAVAWILSPAHWWGPDGVLTHTAEHVEITALSVAVALAIALPAGLYVGHTRRGEKAAVWTANLGRALPAFGILGIVFPFTLSLPGFGFYPTLIAMVLLAIPPILTNTYVGVRSVEADTVEAARGMGMSEVQLLRRIELPLAAPVIVAGIRTSAVAVVATATLAAVFGWGGYGRYIFDGFYQNDTVKILVGAILVAALAVVTELVLAVAEHLVRPARGAAAAGATA